MREIDVFEETEAHAIKRVLALQTAEAMTAEGISKAVMALRNGTSRSPLDRLLDANSGDWKLSTLTRAARAVGRSLRLELT